MAMAVVSLLLGLKPDPEISFQDAIIVFYLLAMSWFTVVLCLPSCQRFDSGVRILKLWSIAQSVIVFAFLFALLRQAPTFGANPQCNAHAVVVLFRPFSALHAGRIVAWIASVVVVVCYTVVTVVDYIPPAPKQHVVGWIRAKRLRGGAAGLLGLPKDQRDAKSDTAPEPKLDTRGNRAALGPGPQLNRPATPPKYDLPVAWDLIIELLVMLVLWALAVMNTELLIQWNDFEPSDKAESAWQFGQVLPMFLAVLPFVNMVSAFMEFGLKPWRKSESEHTGSSK